MATRNQKGEQKEPGKCHILNCEICKLEDFIHDNWKIYLKEEIESDEFKSLKNSLHEREFYPPPNQIFAFTRYTKLEDVKVVIIGQNPYHNENQAMGLAFSVPCDIKIPRSLQNIFKELNDDIEDFTIPESGNLIKWAKQGVLLLNEVLTTEPKRSGSHSKIGWERMTTKIVQLISSGGKNVVFMLWGLKAQTKSTLIDKSKHKILECSHPSPMSARKGFFGCKHFSQANEYLKKYNKIEINWKLT